MLEEAGHLNKFWHVCAFSHEVKQTPLSVKIYNTPIVLWRNKALKISALLDSCPHRASPLSAGQCQGDTITCPYHGWTFDQGGRCINIPCEDPQFKIRKRIPSFQIREDMGLVWIFLDPKQSAPELPISFTPYKTKGWQFVFEKKLFNTNAELLIENFMDSSHTSFVHKGLIRGIGKKTKRTIQVSSEDRQVVISHPKTNEKVGIGSNWLVGRNAQVEHTDAFILPSIVKVDYKFVPKNKAFLAFIFCTPVSAKQTVAHVLIGIRFGVCNYIIKPILPLLIRKILSQDELITRLQQDNLGLLKNPKECDTPSDYMHRQVKNLRDQFLPRQSSDVNYRNGAKQFPVWF